MLGNSAGITVNYDGKSATVPIQFQAVMIDTIGDSASDAKMVSHTFVISNYDLGEKITEMNLQGSANEEGRMRVGFTIIGEKGTDEKTPIKVGEYLSRVGNVGETINSANGGYFAVSVDGKEELKFLTLSEMKAGKIKIDSVSGDTVSGEVDITDGDMSIKGKFTLKK